MVLRELRRGGFCDERGITEPETSPLKKALHKRRFQPRGRIAGLAISPFAQRLISPAYVSPAKARNHARNTASSLDSPKCSDAGGQRFPISNPPQMPAIDWEASLRVARTRCFVAKCEAGKSSRPSPMTNVARSFTLFTFPPAETASARSRARCCWAGGAL
jgi:hypothetical protein